MEDFIFAYIFRKAQMLSGTCLEQEAERSLLEPEAGSTEWTEGWTMLSKLTLSLHDILPLEGVYLISKELHQLETKCSNTLAWWHHCKPTQQSKLKKTLISICQLSVTITKCLTLASLKMKQTCYDIMTLKFPAWDLGAPGVLISTEVNMSRQTWKPESLYSRKQRDRTGSNLQFLLFCNPFKLVPQYLWWTSNLAFSHWLFLSAVSKGVCIYAIPVHNPFGQHAFNSLKTSL